MIFTIAQIDLILLAQKENDLHVNTWRIIVIEEMQTAKKTTENIIKIIIEQKI